MTVNKKIKCRRCGKCCVVFDIDLKEWIDCRWLIKYANGKTGCAIYRHRLGAIVGEGITVLGGDIYLQDCGRREDRHYNIPDCPYNKKGQIIHDNYK